MPETLLTLSSVKLYGRIITDMVYRDDAPNIGKNNFLQSQLSVNTSSQINATAISTTSPHVTVAATSIGSVSVGQFVSAQIAIGSGSTAVNVNAFDGNTIVTSVRPSTATSNPNTFDVTPAPLLAATSSTQLSLTVRPLFARIYAFSFEGAVYSLPRPSIFIVHGSGFLVDPNQFSSGRTSVDQSGVVAREWEFASPSQADLRYWEYEKGDFSIRLDTEAGQFEQILLAAALRAGADMADRSGASLSGASLGVRSGASLAGASLSGASLSGASLAGASLSGASLRNR